MLGDDEPALAADGADVLSLALGDRARAVDGEVGATGWAAADPADAVAADGCHAIGAVLDRRAAAAAAREARRWRRERSTQGRGGVGLKRRKRVQAREMAAIVPEYVRCEYPHATAAADERTSEAGGEFRRDTLAPHHLGSHEHEWTAAVFACRAPCR